VGNAALAKQASDLLLEKHSIYVQSINYPTVPVGQERLRITPTPGHTRSYREHLVSALDSVFSELGIKRTSEWAAEGGFIGVGEAKADKSLEEPLWTDAQLGVENEVKQLKASAGPTRTGIVDLLLEREAQASPARAVSAAAAAAAA
jgi:5-aminolevulinate synthase